MNRKCGRLMGVVATMLCVIGLPGCGHEQQLVSIDVEPAIETFGANNIPVKANAGSSVQLRALGSYIHPPVVKDITAQVVWASNTPQMITVNSTGLITATGNACGSSLVSATVRTNKSPGNLSSEGAVITGTMTANVICPSAALQRSGPMVTANLARPGSARRPASAE